MGFIVQKYGGTSVGDSERIKVVAGRIAEEAHRGHQVVVVVSAMGDSTDRLLDLAKQLNPSPPDREMDMLLATGEQVSIALLAMALQAVGIPALSLTGPQAGIRTDSGEIPNDPELPLMLDRVYPCHEVVKIDYYLPGCPPPADKLWEALVALLTDKPVELPYELIKYD